MSVERRPNLALSRRPRSKMVSAIRSPGTKVNGLNWPRPAPPESRRSDCIPCTYNQEGFFVMTDRRRAFVTGITGQDGAFLAELLLEKDYEVHGLVRRSSTFNTERLQHLDKDQHEQNSRLKLHFGDLTDGTGLLKLILSIEPDEIYNLAAQSHVRVSFDQPLFTADVDALGTLRILEAARML